MFFTFISFETIENINKKNIFKNWKYFIEVNEIFNIFFSNEGCAIIFYNDKQSFIWISLNYVSTRFKNCKKIIYDYFY